jgi:hypothetical protein
VIKNKKNATPLDVIDDMRSGNVFIVQGDLIDDLKFTASKGCGQGERVTMGETLTVKMGDEACIKVRLHDPEGANHYPGWETRRAERGATGSTVLAVRRRCLWEKFEALLERMPLPIPKIIHAV